MNDRLKNFTARIPRLTWPKFTHKLDGSSEDVEAANNRFWLIKSAAGISILATPFVMIYNAEKSPQVLQTEAILLIALVIWGQWELNSAANRVK